MSLACKLILGASLIAAALTPGHAAVAHKWVDADGLTHYSDTPPAASTPVTRIDLTAAKNTTREEGFHSIANQWQRLQRERWRRDRVELEKARLEAAKARPDPRVVYVDRPAAKRYRVGRRGPAHRKFGYYRSARPLKHRLRSAGHRNQPAERTSLGYFPHPK